MVLRIHLYDAHHRPSPLLPLSLASPLQRSSPPLLSLFFLFHLIPFVYTSTFFRYNNVTAQKEQDGTISEFSDSGRYPIQSPKTDQKGRGIYILM